MQNLGLGNPYYTGRLQADAVAVLVLAANTEQHFTIPTGAEIAVFSSTSDFYVLVNGQTAAVPGSTNTTFPSPNTVPDLNPTVLSVTAGNLMSVVAPATPVVVISFYQNTK